MKRALKLVALSLPFVVALLPASVDAYHIPGHTNYHDVSMLQPVGLFNGYAHLHCKVHASCGWAPGTGVDWHYWTNYSDRRVWWRASLEWGQENIRLLLHVSNNCDEGCGWCDRFEVYIYDQARGDTLVGIMQYVHSWAGSPGQRTYIQLGPGNYKVAYNYGNMTWDENCAGGWTGYHVHEDAVSQQYLNTPRYSGGYFGAYCSPQHATPNGEHLGDDCSLVLIGDRAAWTRSWHW